MDLPKGYLLNNRYRIEALLGQGGFGKTYKVFDVNLHQYYCLKELYIGGSSTRGSDYTVNSIAVNGVSFSDFKQKFIREAQDLAKFRHPNIVQVINVFEANNTAYYVMEFVEGETLKEHVDRNGPFARDAAIPVMRQLLDAVDEVHRKGMLHRDIKPSNVIIDASGRLVLIDFGSAREFEAGRAATQTAMVTPGYSPWEQYSEQGKRDVTSDIYALGATMYFLLTGERPIAAPDRMDADMKAPHELNPKVDSQISSAVVLAMEMRPADRFQTIADFRSALEFLSGNKSSSPKRDAPHPPVQGETEKTKRSNAAVWVVMVLVILAGTAAAVHYFTPVDLFGGLTARMEEDELNPGPKEVASKFIEHINNMEFDKAKQYGTKSTNDILDMIASFAGMAQEKPEATDFIILDVKEDGDKATVTYRNDGADEDESIQLVHQDGQWLVDMNKEEMDKEEGVEDDFEAFEEEEYDNYNWNEEEASTPAEVAWTFIYHINRLELEQAKAYGTESTVEILEMLSAFVDLADETPTATGFEIIQVREYGSQAKVVYMNEGADELEELNLIFEDGQWLVDIHKEDLDKEEMDGLLEEDW